jgi:SAM-dependent methyltransferase
MANDNRWLNSRKEGGKVYDARFEALQKTGQDVHGEANFVMRYGPTTVLDAGCGTGRVAIELARRGCKIVGLDIDPEMLSRAREKAPELDWRLGDLADAELGQQFDLVVMAGNVMLFVSPGTEAKVVLNMSRHLSRGGKLIAGFQLGRGLSLEQYSQFCAAAGLNPLETYATWDGQEFTPSADYVVAVHQKG